MYVYPMYLYGIVCAVWLLMCCLRRVQHVYTCVYIYIYNYAPCLISVLGRTGPARTGPGHNNT